MSSDLHLKMASNDKKDGRVHDSRRDSLERGYKPFRGNPEREPPKETNRDDPHSLRCRVFIGNLQMSRKELEDAFSQYGRVTGCSVHNNYGFVQFEDEKAADVAVAQENGKVYYGKRVDVNLAGERRKETRGDKKMERDSRPPPFPPNRREREFDRDVGRPYRKSPPRERPRFEDYDRFPSRFEAPYDRRGRSPSPPPPRRTDERPYGRQDDYYMREQREQRERYRAEPYNREPYPRHSFDHRGGESFERDRRDPYDSPRAPYPDRSGDDRRDRFDSYSRDYSRPDEHPSPAKRPKMDYEASSSLDDIYSSKSIEAPTDCVIVVMNKQQRGYAEMVERRLKSVGLVVELHFHGTQPITELLDDVARRGVLYAIVITSQHEVHRSVTVNILHGTPQEHRNMPLDDAMRLVGQNFEKYMQDLRERARLSSSSSAPSQESSKPATSAPPKEQKSEVSQLLSKAATGDDLSADQLTKLIDSLSKRQEELIGSTTTANGKGGSTASHSSQPAVDPQSIAKQQADLQAKILSILNPGGASKTGATSAASNMTFSQSTSQKLGSIAASTIQKPIAPAALSTNTKPIFPLYPAQKPAASAPTGGYMSTSSSGVTSSRVLPVATTARSASSLSGNQVGKPYSAVSRFESSGSTSQYAGAASAAGKQNQPFQFSKPSAPASQGTTRGVAASSNALGSKVAVSPAAQSYSATTKNLQGQTGRAVSATAQPLSSATSAAKSPIQVASQPSKFSPAISQPSKFSPAGQAIMTVGGGSPRTVVSAAPRQPVPTGGPRMSSPMGAPRAVTSIAGSQTRSPSPVAARGRSVMSAGTGTPPRGLTPTRGIRPSLGAPGARMMAPRAPVPVSGTGRSTTPLGTTRAPTAGGMQVARGRGVPARGRAAGGVTGSPYSTSSPSQGYSSSQGVSSPQLAQKSPGALSGAGRGSTAPANTPPSRGVPVRRGVPVTRGALPMRGGGAGVRGGPSTRGALLARPQGPGGPVRGGALRGGAPRGALISGGPPPRGGLVARGGPLSRGAPRGRVLIRGGPYRGGPGRGAPGGHSGYGPSQGYGY